jgi:hypothetical protein
MFRFVRQFSSKWGENRRNPTKMDRTGANFNAVLWKRRLSSCSGQILILNKSRNSETILVKMVYELLKSAKKIKRRRSFLCTTFSIQHWVQKKHCYWKRYKYVSRLRFIETAIQFINSVVHTYTLWTWRSEKWHIGVKPQNISKTVKLQF